MSETSLVTPEQIQSRIHEVHGRRVMLDADLAQCYGVGTRDLNKAVGRNLDRFPDDFAFMLTLAETRGFDVPTWNIKSGPRWRAQASPRLYRTGSGHAGERAP